LACEVEPEVRLLAVERELLVLLRVVDPLRERVEDPELRFDEERPPVERELVPEPEPLPEPEPELDREPLPELALRERDPDPPDFEPPDPPLDPPEELLEPPLPLLDPPLSAMSSASSVASENYVGPPDAVRVPGTIPRWNAGRRPVVETLRSVRSASRV
jgi:hypothetical protein